jgi:hypothetical protein
MGGANPRDVDAAVGDCGMLLIPFDADGVYRGLWMLPGELLHGIGDDAGAEADSEGTRGAAGGLDAAASRGRAGEECLGSADEGGAGRGERDLVMVSLEECHPEVCF